MCELNISLKYPFLGVYCKCSGEIWPLFVNGESHAVRYLKQIEGILSIENEKNELVWYVRGKTLNGQNRGEIYRANNQPKTDFDLSTSPHGNRIDTCIPNNNNNNNFHNNRNNYNSNKNNNNKAKVDRNNNAHNGFNGNYNHPRNGTQLVELDVLFLFSILFFSFLFPLLKFRIISCLFVRSIPNRDLFSRYSQTKILHKQSKAREWP